MSIRALVRRTTTSSELLFSVPTSPWDYVRLDPPQLRVYSISSDGRLALTPTSPFLEFVAPLQYTQDAQSVVEYLEMSTDPRAANLHSLFVEFWVQWLLSYLHHVDSYPDGTVRIAVDSGRLGVTVGYGANLDMLAPFLDPLVIRTIEVDTVIVDQEDLQELQDLGFAMKAEEDDVFVKSGGVGMSPWSVSLKRLSFLTDLTTYRTTLAFSSSVKNMAFQKHRMLRSLASLETLVSYYHL